MATADLGRVRLSWGHPDAALEVVSEGPTFEGDFNLVLRNGDGLVAALHSTEGPVDLGSVRLEHGGGRGSKLSTCGTQSVTDLKVTVGADTPWRSTALDAPTRPAGRWCAIHPEAPHPYVGVVVRSS